MDVLILLHEMRALFTYVCFLLYIVVLCTSLDNHYYIHVDWVTDSVYG